MGFTTIPLVQLGWDRMEERTTGLGPCGSFQPLYVAGAHLSQYLERSSRKIHLCEPAIFGREDEYKPAFLVSLEEFRQCYHAEDGSYVFALSREVNGLHVIPSVYNDTEVSTETFFSGSELKHSVFEVSGLHKDSAEEDAAFWQPESAVPGQKRARSDSDV